MTEETKPRRPSDPERALMLASKNAAQQAMADLPSHARMTALTLMVVEEIATLPMEVQRKRAIEVFTNALPNGVSIRLALQEAEAEVDKALGEFEGTRQ